jgi:hypothetical protein
VDPALFLELEEKSIGYLRHGGVQALAQGGPSIPYYEVDVRVNNATIPKLAQSGLPGQFRFRIRNVIDCVYLTFTPRGEPRLVAMDWKTNAIDEHSGEPSFAVREDHHTQLKHHALYLLQRYSDVFERYDHEITLAFQRAGRVKPTLPKQLTADMVFVGDVYLAGKDFGAEYRFQPHCAADLDHDLFVAELRGKLAKKLSKFSSIDPVRTGLEFWEPKRADGTATDRCEYCAQVPVCPSVPAAIRDEWPASVTDLLARLTPPPRPLAGW